MIINYACKSKELWKIPCPIFVRGIGMEGGIGPVAGSSHHSLYFRMPGIKIASPMTPKEYITVYNHFMKDDNVYYVSEHRKSYDNFKNSKKAFIQEDILVAMGIIIKPIFSKKIILIEIFINTEINE